MYDKLAAVYDRFMLEDVDYKAYASWINEILSKRIGKRKNLLEVGCGTGNITMEMHDLGYEVTGLDISEEMLVEADNKAFAAGADIQWIQGDISRLSLPARFDAVISTMDTFNYLLEEKALKEALHKVYESLRPGGTFIFDVNTPYRLETVYGNNSFHYLGDDVCYIWECHYDQVLDICSYDIAFFVQDTGDRYQRFDEYHEQRSYSQEHLSKWLEDAGFMDVEILDFATKETPKSISEKILLVAQKRG
ncbi:class I SAM-dependent methyltransferase [Alkalibacter rhizosphaerae]|uniref:Class I SAM-dependent methyltransferase n=1 Tax=Alkalibacter rhizosphaerae TaxID=2815577 RepID=A0A974XM68_9FIRM|nr:class I SAM-dependent methyltransferase [Alkalibacter rhizosphaerae]QSX08491.1 class I SAM-dependent methyltransferase [Alkalibacter rhizosphaerae]